MLGAVLLVALFASSGVGAASLFDPALRFRVLRTEHFVIYFHDGEQAAAWRLQAIAEDTWRTLAARFGQAPPRTHVVIVDQTDLSNGYATPLPRDTIVITAAWPSGSEFIGRTEDWLRLVFTHEFTHIVHLDRSASWARIVRQIFGRAPLAFPNLFLPVWQIEGLATYEESAITGDGRLHAGEFQQITSAAARRGALEPLDRANGGLIDWPGGLAAYAYGLGFHAWLAERYGDATLTALASATSGRVPYTASRVFERIFGRPLGDLWRDYETSLVSASSAPPVAARRRLTHHGFYVSGPRFDRSACAGCPPRLIYSVQTPHAFPSLNRVALDGGGMERLATRYLGSASGVSANVVVFDQQEIRRNVGVYSDLYALDMQSHRVRPLTHEARIVDPDLSPDGGTIVAARQTTTTTREIVALALDTVAPSRPRIRVVLSEPDTQFNGPRWSPDGRLIAAERHRRGGLSDIVVADAASGAIRSTIALEGARIVTPSWRPDGRAVIVAAAIDDRPFQIYEVPLDGAAPRVLTDADGGALWPEPSPDGQTLVYVGYTIDGFDLFSEPYRSHEQPSDAALLRATEGGAAVSTAAAAPAESAFRSSPYSPLPTLLPTSWSPIVAGDSRSIRFGAEVAGSDVLGYHAYAASATWRVTSPEAIAAPSNATPDWSVAYAYTRWRPILYVSASTDTSFFGAFRDAADADGFVDAARRETAFEAGAIVPIQHVRASHMARAAFVVAADDFSVKVDGGTSRRKAALRGAWATTTAHTFGYSISAERGVAAGATVERVDRRIGASADAVTATGDARLYLPAFGAHDVFALRAAGGSSSGDLRLERAFSLGGAGPNLDPIDFGSDAISLLRGFPVDAFVGDRVVLVNADYRFPIARPQRGVGTWPLFIKTIHAAVFVDAGDAWTRRFAARMNTSFGGELSIDVVAGYFLPLTITAGAARGHDPSLGAADATTVYVRVGRAF